MKKVAIVGCGGSGKSHLARELGRLLGAPVTHLDAVYYDDEWNALPMEKFEALQRDLVSARSWVIDGNYNSTLQVRLEACDTVVFMDMPTITCLWGVLSRQLRHGRGQNKKDGIYNRIHLGVLRYVWSYRRKMRPRVMQKIDEFAGHHAEVVLLTSRRQTRLWLERTAATLH
ncbi:P-loop NTPase family protein [Streptomyces lonegramiae]|uniref:Topology modulation protein n=1 Tax=Streptomyces lonegramiae TaxID=3075524 RepID=A0ABU2XP34_9ACTN|nr:topology modulation protein [Streptomyces sp. DSM 41529]MDT0547689.1 topology modulation protein [Streptomyces sp. DSM 41529]